MKQKQSLSIKHDEFEDRLKITEAKLKKQESNVTSNKHDDDAVLLVRHLPYGMKDDEDAQLLLSDGLGLNIRIRSTHRAPSINHEAGILTIKLASQDDKLKVMSNKWKLSNSDKNYRVYIDGGEFPLNRRPMSESLKCWLVIFMVVDTTQQWNSTEHTTIVIDIGNDKNIAGLLVIRMNEIT